MVVAPEVVVVAELAVVVDPAAVVGVTAGVVVGVVAGAAPVGLESRNSLIVLAEVGFGIEVPFGTKASTISWPSLNRRLEASLVMIVPVFADGELHTSTSTTPGLPSQD